MNRCETAISCVRALAAQTVTPEWIVIADNVSTDETVQRLLEEQFLIRNQIRLIVHRMAENLGNAGGVQAAMEIAFDLGADAVWILDDDSWPRPAALEALISARWEPFTVRHSLQLEPNTSHFTWALPVLKANGSWSLHTSLLSLPKQPFLPTLASWTGALISKRIRQAVGPVNGALFIRGEDEEYPWRIRKAGFQFEAAINSILDHPGPARLIQLRILNKHFFYEPGLANWKLYYKIRNMVWLKNQQSGPIASWITAICYAFLVTRYDGPKRWPTLIRAISDGLRSRLGCRHQPPAQGAQTPCSQSP